MNFSVIGGSDGPTSIFIAGKIGPEWLNIFGLIVIIVLLIPNIIFALKFHNQNNKCNNRVMNALEQIGRYSSMFLMVFNIGVAELGVHSVEAFLIYSIGNVVLLLAYWSIWMLYFYRQDEWKAVLLAVIPTCVFIMSGITLGHILLIVSGVIFGIGHIYVTKQNANS